jgi:hypothetical protein
MPPDLHRGGEKYKGQEHEAWNNAEHSAADKASRDRAGTHDQHEGQFRPTTAKLRSRL